MHFEISGGSKSYSVLLKQDLITQKAEFLYREIRRLIQTMRKKHGNEESPVALQVTHRLIRLPGCKEMLCGIRGAQIIELVPGAGALGVLKLGDQLLGQPQPNGISLFSSRPWKEHRRETREPGMQRVPKDARPTHLLYDGMAYLITEKPLYVGQQGNPGDGRVSISRHASRLSRKSCSVYLQDRKVVLHEYGTDHVFVDETRITVEALLTLGQRIRIGTSQEPLQLIACVDSHDWE